MDDCAGAEAGKLIADAKELLETLTCGEKLVAKGVVGMFPANSSGDDILVYADKTRATPLAVLHTLRQQLNKLPGRSNYALSDFVAPCESGKLDHVGAFTVTVHGAQELERQFAESGDDYHSIMTGLLADRLVEAFAERLHQVIRKELWGYAVDETLGSTELITEKYVGIRPAPGYPAQPDHTEKRAIFDLLDAERATGASLTETFAMSPAASICGLYFSHPRAAYFSVGKINKDQAEDYAVRKGMDLKTAERWLAPILDYEP